jgi:hypothetical protein
MSSVPRIEEKREQYRPCGIKRKLLSEETESKNEIITK